MSRAGLGQRRNLDVRLNTLTHQAKQVIGRRNCGLNVEVLRVEGTCEVDELISDDVTVTPGGCVTLKTNKVTEMNENEGVIVEQHIPFHRHGYGRASIRNFPVLIQRNTPSGVYNLSTEPFILDFEGSGEQIWAQGAEGEGEGGVRSLMRFPTTYANTCIDDFCLHCEFNVSFQFQYEWSSSPEAKLQVRLFNISTGELVSTGELYLEQGDYEGGLPIHTVIIHDRFQCMPGEEFGIQFEWSDFDAFGSSLVLLADELGMASHIEWQICNIERKTPTPQGCCNIGNFDLGFRTTVPYQGGPSFNVNNAAAILVQPDNKFLVLGTANQFPAAIDVSARFQWIARYNNDGTIDASYGTAGFGQRSNFVYGSDNYVHRALLQSDGKVIVAANIFNGAGPRTAICRWDANGNPDPTFGVTATGVTLGAAPGAGAGSAPFPGGGGAVTDAAANWGVAIRADGSYVTCLRNHIYAYTSSGAFDLSFGTMGAVILTSLGIFTDSTVQPETILVLPDGKMLVCGSDDSRSAPFVVRLNGNGTLDTSFGVGGRTDLAVGMREFRVKTVNEPLISYERFVRDMQILDNGNILCIGHQEKPFAALLDADGNILIERLVALENQIQTNVQNLVFRSTLCSQTHCLVSGYTRDIGGSQNGLIAFMLRITDLTVDTTFGNNGILLEIGTQRDQNETGRVSAVAVDGNGDFICAGQKAGLTVPNVPVTLDKVICSPTSGAPRLLDHCMARPNDAADVPKSYGFFFIPNAPGSNPIDWSTLRIVSVQSFTSDSGIVSCGDTIAYGTNTAANIFDGLSTYMRVGGVDYPIDANTAGVSLVYPTNEVTYTISFFHNNEGDFRIDLGTNGNTSWDETINYAFKAVINVADTMGVRSNDACCEFILQRVT